MELKSQVTPNRTHCVKCGTPHQETVFPKKCPHCGTEMYENPIPVVVVLVPVKGKGILIQKRAIEPKIGRYGLISGYLNPGENPEDGAKREALEECGVTLTSVKFLTFDYGASRKNLLMFFLSNEILEEDINFQPNSEVSEIKFVNVDSANIKLGFISHTKYLKEYLEGKWT